MKKMKMKRIVWMVMAALAAGQEIGWGDAHARAETKNQALLSISDSLAQISRKEPISKQQIEGRAAVLAQKQKPARSENIKRQPIAKRAVKSLIEPRKGKDGITLRLAEMVPAASAATVQLASKKQGELRIQDRFRGDPADYADAQKGLDAYWSGNRQDAQGYWEKAWAAGNVQAGSWLARVWRERGESKEALAWLLATEKKKALEWEDALLGAQIWRSEGDFGAGLEWLEKWPESQRSRKEYWLEKGILLLGYGKTKDAEEIFGEGMKKSPEGSLELTLGLLSCYLLNADEIGARTAAQSLVQRQDTPPAIKDRLRSRFGL